MLILYTIPSYDSDKDPLWVKNMTINSKRNEKILFGLYNQININPNKLRTAEVAKGLALLVNKDYKDKIEDILNNHNLLGKNAYFFKLYKEDPDLYNNLTVIPDEFTINLYNLSIGEPK